MHASRLHTAVCQYNQVKETISDTDKNLVLDLMKSAEEVNICFCCNLNQKPPKFFPRKGWLLITTVLFSDFLYLSVI